MWAIYILIFIILFLLLIMRMKITVDMEVKYNGKQEDVKITVMALFNLIKYKVKIPKINIDEQEGAIKVKEEQKLGEEENAPTQKKKMKITGGEILHRIGLTKEFLKHVKGFYKIVIYFFSHVKVTKFQWTTAFGVGDAADTGIISGLLWSIKGSTLGLIGNYMQLKTKPYVHIEPLFTQTYLETSLKCMISFRIGHAIGAVFRIVKYWKKQRGGNQNVKSSYSRFNDDGNGELKAND